MTTFILGLCIGTYIGVGIMCVIQIAKEDTNDN